MAYVGPCQSGWNKAANRDATPEEIAGMMPTFKEIAAEVHRRAALPDCSPEIFGAHVRAMLPSARESANHWTEEKAIAAGDVDAKRCIHGKPLNVFCGRCES
jgi:hypothetical protein